MKISIVALSCIAQLPLHARPATTSAVEVDGDNSTEWSLNVACVGIDSSCNNAQVKRDIASRCAQPGARKHHVITCFDCLIGCRDAHPWCDVACCDPNAKVVDDICQCTHFGDSYQVGFKPNDAIKCCARDAGGNPKWTSDGKCGCADVDATLNTGGTADDCCSGTLKDGKCALAPAGKKHKGMRTIDCETGKLDKDGMTCRQGKPGEAVRDPSDCASGKVDKGGHCLCVAAGQKAKDAQACCSAAHEKGSDVCACMPSDYNLHHGATKNDCCSEQVAGGRCLCGNPGRPIKAGRGVTACCAGTAVKGSGDTEYCSCATQKEEVTAEHHGRCCGGGGFYNGTSGKCSCIKSGYIVAGYVPKEGCCSGEIVSKEKNLFCK